MNLVSDFNAELSMAYRCADSTETMRDHDYPMVHREEITPFVAGGRVVPISTLVIRLLWITHKDE